MARYDNSIDRDPFAVGLPSDFLVVNTLSTSGFEVAQDLTPLITNRIITATSGSAITTQLYWTFPPLSNTDMEALCLTRLVVNSSIGVTTNAFMFVRGSSGNAGLGYGAQFVTSGASGGDTVRAICSTTVGVGSAIVSCGTFSWQSGNWYWSRLSMIGSTLTLSMWPLGSSEPATPVITTTSTNILSGNFAIRFQSTSGVGTGSFAWFSGATASETAPGPGYSPMHTTLLLDGAISINKILGY